MLEFWLTIGNNQLTAAIGSLWFGIEIWEDLEEPRLWRDYSRSPAIFEQDLFRIRKMSMSYNSKLAGFKQDYWILIKESEVKANSGRKIVQQNFRVIVNVKDL